jgi:hypothetical protein
MHIFAAWAVPDKSNSVADIRVAVMPAKAGIPCLYEESFFTSYPAGTCGNGFPPAPQ